MKRIISILVTLCIIFTGCSNKLTSEDTTTSKVETTTYKDMKIGSPEMLEFVEDEILDELIATLDSDTYEINGVSAIYISQEYIDEKEYNSQENIYFGYKLSDVSKHFDGKKYVFCLDEDNNTTVKEFEEYDDTYDQILKNVAIGTGVILVCVTVSVATGGLGAPAAVSTVFACAAKGGAIMAASSAAIGGTISATITGIETHDMNAAMKSALLSASEDFKWGAIVGATTAGIAETVSTVKKAKNVEKVTNLIVENKRAGVAREEKVLKTLSKKYKAKDGYDVIREAIIRDANGNPIIDTVTNQARRIDFVVTKGEKAIESVEVTSKTANKAAQIAKEARIRDTGKVFVKNSKGELVELAKDLVTDIWRLK